MNFILISVLLVFLAIGVVGKNPEMRVSEPSPTPTNIPVPTQTPEPETPEPSASTEPLVTQTPSPTQLEEVTYGDWLYPGASVESRDDKLVLTSFDSPDQITDWYKNKITSLGFNVRSFVMTSANDVVKNVLSAAKADREVGVTITKNPGDSLAEIEVTDSL